MIDFIIVFCDIVWYGFVIFAVAGVLIKPVGNKFVEFYQKIRISNIVKEAKR